MDRNSNPVALITGASDGIGFELAKIFATNGYDLIIVSENRAKLESAAAKIIRSVQKSVQVEIIEADLSQEEAPKQLFRDVQHLGIKVDVLVNNAGVGVYGEFASNDLSAELSMIRLNVIATVELTKFFVNEMLRHGGGKVLFTSSVAALSGTPLLSVYGGTKAFIFNFAMGIREELEHTNVSITTLLPSETDTNFFKRAGMEESKTVEGNLADPAKVAQDGYDALMKNESHVASPYKAKVLDILSHILPEDTKAHISKKKQEPKKRAS
jgi:short-subunit dehydrogenase